MSQYNSEPITQLTPGLTVKLTDVYPAVDVTDLTQSPSGSTHKYTVSQLFSAFNIISWQAIPGTTQLAVINTGYVNQNAALTTVTLPATAALGSTIRVQGLGTGGWTIQTGLGQNIQVGSFSSSTNGTVSSSNRYDTIELICIVANTTWSVGSSVTSGFIIT